MKKISTLFVALCALAPAAAQNHGSMNFIGNSTFTATLFNASQATVKDTVIVGRQSIVLDSTTIYAYPEEYRSWNDYKMKKISGLSSLVVWHNSNISPKKFNLSKDTSCFDTQKDTCYITITQEMIE